MHECMYENVCVCYMCKVTVNNKLDADMKKIQTVGKYMAEVWRALGVTDLPRFVFRLVLLVIDTLPIIPQKCAMQLRRKREQERERE
jgi:hypothetical protein